MSQIQDLGTTPNVPIVPIVYILLPAACKLFRCHFHIDRFFSLSGSGPGERVLRTDLDTFTAADTFSTVRILHGVDAHLALAGACTAVDAGAFIEAHAQNADLLEKRVFEHAVFLAGSSFPGRISEIRRLSRA